MGKLFFKPYGGFRKNSYHLWSYFGRFRSPYGGFIQIKPPFGEPSGGYKTAKRQLYPLYPFRDVDIFEPPFDVGNKSNPFVVRKTLASPKV